MSGVVLVKPLLSDGSTGEWSPNMVIGAPGSATLASEETYDKIVTVLTEIAAWEGMGYDPAPAQDLLDNLSSMIDISTKEATLQLVLNLLTNLELNTGNISNIYNGIQFSTLVLDNDLTAINNLYALISPTNNANSWQGKYNNTVGVFTVIYNPNGTINRFTFKDKNNVISDPVDLSGIADVTFYYNQFLANCNNTPLAVTFGAAARKVKIDNHGAEWVYFHLIIEGIGKPFFLAPNKSLVYEDNTGELTFISGIQNIRTCENPAVYIGSNNIAAADGLYENPKAADNLISIEAWNN